MIPSDSSAPQDSIYERAGGFEGLHRVVDMFYASIFQDPILKPLFPQPIALHVEHLTAFLAEVFGGPKRYTNELGGFPKIISVHRARRITEQQRQRFVELFMAAVDAKGLGADTQLRMAIGSCIEFGSQIAMVNSHAATDAELHPQREMPRWHW
jgi:hemoglobin